MMKKKMASRLNKSFNSVFTVDDVSCIRQPEGFFFLWSEDETLKVTKIKNLEVLKLLYLIDLDKSIGPKN